MQTVEAIRVVRGVMEQKRAFAATARAHPLANEGYMKSAARQADREAKAMQIVCDKLTAFLAQHEEDCSYHSR